MTATWPKVRLGEVMALSKSAIPSAELPEVNLAGVYSFGRGLFARGPMCPGKTSYKTYNRLVTDDFVISQPKAWEGALARVTPQFDGWYLSPVFPTFRANRTRLEPAFLEWFCKRQAVWAELQRNSRGIGARRETVSPETFLALEIPLPPLAEQRQIVARIETLAGLIDEARALRQEVDEEAKALCRSVLTGDKGSEPTAMNDLVRLRQPDVVVQPQESYQFAGVYCFGRGVFRSDVKMGVEFAYARLTRLQAGNFVYPKLMAWEGAFGVVPKECDGCVVSPSSPYSRSMRRRSSPRYWTPTSARPLSGPKLQVPVRVPMSAAVA